MTELLTAYLNFMLEGPQQFCVGCVIPGFFMWFSKPLPQPARKAKPRRIVAKRGRVTPVVSQAQKAVKLGKKRKSKKKSKAGENQLSPREQILHDSYIAKRDRVDIGGWTFAGYGVPL